MFFSEIWQKWKKKFPEHNIIMKFELKEWKLIYVYNILSKQYCLLKNKLNHLKFKKLNNFSYVLILSVMLIIINFESKR